MKNVSYLQEWKSVHKCTIDVNYELPEDYDIEFLRVTMRGDILSDSLHSALFIDTTDIDIIRVIEVSYKHANPYVVYKVSPTTLLYLLLSYKCLDLLNNSRLDYLLKRVKTYLKKGYTI